MPKLDFKIEVDNRKIITDQAKKQIMDALEDCGKVAEGYAKVNLTDQKAVDTGELRRIVTHKVVHEKGKDVCYIGVPHSSRKSYGAYVELGTGIYYQGGRKTKWTYKDRKGKWHMTNGMKPRPFIKPAIADHQDKYKQILEMALRK